MNHRSLLLAVSVATAGLAFVACGGRSDETTTAAARGQSQSAGDQALAQAEQSQAQTASEPDDSQLDQPGPDLRVPGLAVYTVGADIWLQRGAYAERLIEGSQRINLFTPTLAPAGDRVAYVRFDQAPGNVGDIGSDLHVYDIIGLDTPMRVHAQAGEFFWTPAWSADGSYLFYSHQTNQEDDGSGALFRIAIEEIDLETGAVSVVREDAAEPAQSPDGATLAFIDQPAIDHILAVMDLASGESRVLLDSDDNLAFFRVLRFSPDGQLLAFLASGDGPLVSSLPSVPPANLATNGIQDVWTVRLDGTGLTRLTTVLEDSPDFSWSADGSQILVRGAFGVYLVDIASRVTQTLGPGEFHGTHDWLGDAARDAS